ncbi:MAG: hypothetical protein QW051_00225 [Candidatus Aenigmatarchaeota archaeon]
MSKWTTIAVDGEIKKNLKLLKLKLLKYTVNDVVKFLIDFYEKNSEQKTEQKVEQNENR